MGQPMLRRLLAAGHAVRACGGVAGAEAGTLTIMLGGPAELVERARPILEALGDSLVHVGDRPADGDAAKTINNMLSATNLLAAAEGLAIGIRARAGSGAPGRLRQHRRRVS
jgi:3-hydroxyisobutyrate dehydrogenase-like beta-hydroxyacid dehydrogenase